MKHKGITLGRWARDPSYFRVRAGREIAVARAAGLSREWLEAYVQWFRSRGEPQEAMKLKAEWMRAQR